MNTLPVNLHTAEQVREFDHRAIEEHGIPGYTLMTRAAEAALRVLRERWPGVRRIAIVCGPGNNGGDGYVLARLAREAGIEAKVIEMAESERLEGDAATARADWLQAGGKTAKAIGPGTDLASTFSEAEAIIDALLGTGIDRPVTGVYAEWVAAINAANCPVLAIDIPSGLDADCGAIHGCAVRADLTVTFIALKAGLFTGQGPEYAGEVRLAELGVPKAVLADTEPLARRIDAAALSGLLPARPRTAHKGTNGHVLVVGGDIGMAGAARLAGEAALRGGAGLVTVATRPEHAAPLAAAQPELMCHGITSPRDLVPLLHRADAVAIGPGLGRERWGRALFGFVIEAGLPLVVDADAINFLAVEPAFRHDWVLTPHPGEAARLLGEGVGDIQYNRFTAAAGVMASFGGTCVLKGAGTIVHGPEAGVFVCTAGNPGMASGGMGDVLTGVITALIAQGHAPETAARAGVALHAAAGDAAAREGGERGLIASDLFPHLRRLANP